jgi:hypothetical protein
MEVTMTDDDDKQEEAAYRRLCSARADQFARDLDRLGWKIVMQRPLEPGEPTPRGWPMNGTEGPCPWWAEDPSKPMMKPPMLPWLN